MALAMNSMTKQNKKTNKKEAKKLSKAQKQKKKETNTMYSKIYCTKFSKITPPPSPTSFLTIPPYPLFF